MAIAKALDLDLPSMRVALSPFDTANDLAAFSTAITYRHLFHAASLEYEALGRLAPRAR